MKKLLLTLALLASTSSAFAAGPVCFHFINGKGPQKLGNFAFGGTAQKVCLTTHNIRLFDDLGDLAIVGADVVSTGRCAGVCHQFNLSYGNINGENVDLNGGAVEVRAETDPYLGILKGTLTVHAGRGFPESYLIMEAK